MRSVVLVVLAVLMGAVPRGSYAQQPDVCVSIVPNNIQAGIFVQDVVALLQSSATFRSQCERIAAVPYARIDMDIVQAPGVPRAETTISRYKTGLLKADVRIAFGQNYRELIAHEFEHVIEQIDGVNLREEAEHGAAWLTDRNAFETRRATEVGLRVRREAEISEARAAVAAHAVHATR